MKRPFFVLLLFCLTLFACQSPVPSENTPTAIIPTAPDPTTVPTATAITPPTPTATLPPNTPVATTDLSLSPENIYLYPSPRLEEGDLVTFQFIPYVPTSLPLQDVQANVLVDGVEVASGSLNDRNLNGDAMVVFEWAWDTHGKRGDHQVEIVLDPEDVIQIGDENTDNNVVRLTVTVNPLDPVEANAHWVVAEGQFCFVHVVSGTAGERDLSQLVTTADSAIQQAALKLGEEPNHKIDIYLIDKVIGQGGYAGSSIVISYLDRNYAGNDLFNVLKHESTHIIDRQFAPQRLIFWAEGLAVWVSGGHYKTDDLDQRAAALVRTEMYVPLADLINDFYPTQHEVGYSEAAGLINYLVAQKGWETFRAFYIDVTQDDASTLAEAVDMNMLTYYGKSLAQIETEWLAYLNSLPWDDTAVADLQTTIRYYDTVRRYQSLYDPTAYFLIAWLPTPKDVEAKGNTADLTRHSQEELNVVLEVMFQSADQSLRAGDFPTANALLDSINRVLDNNGRFLDPMSTSYLGIVRTLAQSGYNVQQVNLQGNTAQVAVNTPTNLQLNHIQLTQKGQNWTRSN